MTPARLEPLLRHYGSNARRRLAEQLEFFHTLPDVPAAIRRAALAEDSRGKRFRHQTRIPGRRLEEGYRLLAAKMDRLIAAESFDELLKAVEEVKDSVWGLGDLWAYDTALRIGARLARLPERVYLHSGARVGAARLGLDPDLRSISMDVLPEALQSLMPWEAEDFLCIYKGTLGPPAAEQTQGK